MRRSRLRSSHGHRQHVAVEAEQALHVVKASVREHVVVRQPAIFTDESRHMGGFILAKALVLAGTASDNGTTGGTSHQSVLRFLEG